MGVYIPNMSKPKSCGGCDLSYMDSEWCDVWCAPLVEDVTKVKGILPNCPLIEIDLVRCKECKKHGKNSCPMTFTYAVITDDNNYCSYAERRADEHSDKRD